MGLVIIVVIISLALLFAIKIVFSKKSKAQSVYQSYTHQEVVSSLPDAMFQTDSGCTKDTTVRDLLVDCAKSYSFGGSIKCGDGTRSCDFVSGVIDGMLNGTINQWGIAEGFGYQFIAEVPPEVYVVNITGGNLSQSMGGQTEVYVINLYPSNKELYTYLCIGGCGI